MHYSMQSAMNVLLSVEPVLEEISSYTVLGDALFRDILGNCLDGIRTVDHADTPACCFQQIDVIFHVSERNEF